VEAAKESRRFVKIAVWKKNAGREKSGKLADRLTKELRLRDTVRSSLWGKGPGGEGKHVLQHRTKNRDATEPIIKSALRIFYTPKEDPFRIS